MTDIEQKALELVNAVRHRSDNPFNNLPDTSWYDLRPALLAAIEAHELDKSRHAAEMREQAERFSEACNRVWDLDNFGREQVKKFLSPFILAPVDPLVEAMNAALGTEDDEYFPCHSEALRAALEARGLAIVKKGAVNG